MEDSQETFYDLGPCMSTLETMQALLSRTGAEEAAHDLQFHHVHAVHIVQSCAVPPLIEMLQSSDDELREMSAFAIGRLAQGAEVVRMFKTFLLPAFTLFAANCVLMIKTLWSDTRRTRSSSSVFSSNFPNQIKVLLENQNQPLLEIHSEPY